MFEIALKSFQMSNKMVLTIFILRSGVEGLSYRERLGRLEKVNPHSLLPGVGASRTQTHRFKVRGKISKEAEGQSFRTAGVGYAERVARGSC